MIQFFTYSEEQAQYLMEKDAHPLFVESEKDLHKVCFGIVAQERFVLVKTPWSIHADLVDATNGRHRKVKFDLDLSLSEA